VAFKDHFSRQACDYARFRPRYPAELFTHLASQVPEHACAWDCGTGNGQAALALAPHFSHVIATDASRKQIEHVTPHEKIMYLVSSAEKTPIAAHSVDLITVAQAIHWFNVDLFYAEVERVLNPRGAFAIWCYDLLSISPEIDLVLHDFNENIVGPCWPPERYWIGNHYADLPFPFVEQKAPAFAMRAQWSLDDLLGYLGTWSATQKFIEQRGSDPLEYVASQLAPIWGDPRIMKRVHWPLYVKIGKLSHD
jgi:ubiquinone/menaquinone biosynthesis C-methylase UbiE